MNDYNLKQLDEISTLRDGWDKHKRENDITFDTKLINKVKNIMNEYINKIPKNLNETLLNFDIYPDTDGEIGVYWNNNASALFGNDDIYFYGKLNNFKPIIFKYDSELSSKLLKHSILSINS